MVMIALDILTDITALDEPSYCKCNPRIDIGLSLENTIRVPKRR